MFVELAYPSEDFYHDLNVQQYIYFLLMVGIYLIKEDNLFDNKFLVLNDDRKIFILFCLRSELIKFAYLIVRS